jgi:hypothetical protein
MGMKSSAKFDISGWSAEAKASFACNSKLQYDDKHSYLIGHSRKIFAYKMYDNNPILKSEAKEIL